MPSNALEPGRGLRLTVADPFELSGTVGAHLVGVDDFASGANLEHILIMLDSSLSWAGVGYEYFVLERRSSVSLIDGLQQGRAVEVNGYGTLSPDSPAPWGAGVWRGGLALIATLERVHL